MYAKPHLSMLPHQDATKLLITVTCVLAQMSRSIGPAPAPYQNPKLQDFNAFKIMAQKVAYLNYVA